MANRGTPLMADLGPSHIHLAPSLWSEEPPPGVCWTLVWCTERCFKAENSDIRLRLQAVAQAACGKVACLLP